MTRLPEFDENALTDAQKRVYDRIQSGPRGGVRGPFKALLQAPELGDLVQAVGGHLRYEGALPGDLRELGNSCDRTARIGTIRVFCARADRN